MREHVAAAVDHIAAAQESTRRAWAAVQSASLGHEKETRARVSLTAVVSELNVVRIMVEQVQQNLGEVRSVDRNRGAAREL